MLQSSHLGQLGTRPPNNYGQLRANQSGAPVELASWSNVAAWAIPTACLRRAGASENVLGMSWHVSEAVLKCIWRVLGRLGPSWGILGATRERYQEKHIKINGFWCRK